MGGAHNPRTEKQIFPGWFASAAAAPGSWGAWITGPAVPGASIQAFFGNGYFGRFIHEIPAPGVWDFSTFNFDTDMTNADAKPVGGALTMNAVDPELTETFLEPVDDEVYDLREAEAEKALREAEKAAQEGCAGDGERARSHGDKCPRNEFAQAAHVAHVLLAAQSMDDGTGGEEK